MRSTNRLFLAAVFLLLTAGIVRAQDSAAPPAAAPEAVTAPVAELPAIPFSNPDPPAVEPALTIDPSALTVEPVVPVVAPEPVAAGKPEKARITTTTRVTKKTARKPAERPVAEAVASPEPAAAAAAVSVAAVETSANPPPPDAAAKTEPAKSAAPPPPPASAASVQTPTEETPAPRKMGVGGWILLGFVVAAAFTLITLFRRRRLRKQEPLVDFTGAADLRPSLVSRD